MPMIEAPEWFKHLGAPRSTSDHAWIFSDNRVVHSAPLVSRRAVTIIPGFGPGDSGVRSFDADFLKYLRVLTEKLDSTFSVGIDSELYANSAGIHQDFSRCRTVAGYSMDPMSLAPVNNDRFVAELGLPATFKSDRHKAIFRKFARLVFSTWKACSVKTAKLSTSGAPIWLANAAYKRQHALFLLANNARIRTLWDRRDLVGLASFAKVVFLYNSGRRDQVDAVGKERLVFPLEYALSGGGKGKPQVADKRVVLDGVDYPTFSATRARLFHGAPYAANLVPQIIATGTLHGMFESFPETFHCTSVEELARGIGVSEKVVCSDATEYDRSMATFLIREMFSVAREYWDDSWIDWAEHLAFSAYYSRPVTMRTGKPESKGQLVGNAFDPADQVFRGNPSGHAWTSLIAKFMMVFDFLATADDLLHDVEEQMEAYLRHRKPLKTHNNGDDGMYRGERGLVDLYAKYRFGKDNPGYFSLKPEVGHVWSGYLMVPRVGGGYEAFHRIHTTVEKLFCPERSAGSNFRPRFTIGMLQRLNHGTHPAHSCVIEIIAQTWRDVAAPVYGDLMEMIHRHHERLTLDVNALTEIDRIVLDDPSKLHHRYTEADVSPYVLAMIMEKALAVEDVLPFVSRAYHGRILDTDMAHERAFDIAAATLH